jgi:rhamnopyranosyl-N-acetylglucosaminyl-diphospho-decaprenol beta-1,3/1,4-galactofuranosyltransferase
MINKDLLESGVSNISDLKKLSSVRLKIDSNEKQDPTIVNIIVTYNRSAMLRKTLSELESRGFSNIILINNASQDDTDKVVSEFQSLFVKFCYIKLPENIGGSGGFNVGLKSFVENFAFDSYCILHDDDSWPNFDYREILSLDLVNVNLACFPVIHPDGDLVAMNRPGLLNVITTPFSLKSYVSNRRPLVMNDFNKFIHFDYSSFVGLFMSRSSVINIGFPSEKFFIYSDDTFYTSYATKRCGYKIHNFNSSRLSFIHDCNRSTGESLLSSRFVWYEVRNKLIFLREFSVIWPIHALFFLAKCLILKPRRALLIFKAFFAGLTSRLSEFRPYF